MNWIKLFLVTLSSISIVQGKLKGNTIIDELRNDYLKSVADIWLDINSQNNDVNADKRIVEKIYNVHKEFTLKNMTMELEDYDLMALNHMYEWNILEKDLISVNNLFKAFKNLMEHESHDNFDETTTIDFADTVFKDKNWPIPETFDHIENIMVNQGLYYKAMLEVKDQVCATQRSAAQVLYQLYSAISITELKSYTMMQFSWMLLKTYGKGNYTREAELMRQRFEARTGKTHELLRKVMERADREVWRCDPKSHVEGETYVAITRLLQGYIENEVDMNSDGTCKENCAHYQFTENYGCFKDLYCAKQPRCTGKLLNCKYVDSDMWICPARMHSSRRYEYIEYENGRILGKKGSCSRGTSKVDSWWRYLFWHCSYCFCVCDEQGYQSDRYFNLRETISNTSANMVVTGLRFKKQNRIIHLQIQEGQLLPRGIINPSKIQWKPVNDYKLLDRGLKNGIDYHTMAWDNRAIDLDDLMGPPGHVITGIRFRVVGNHLNFEIRLTEFDFETGLLLDPEASVWVSNDNTEGSGTRRTPVHLRNPDVSINSKSGSQPDSKHNQFIEFTHTDMDADAAQSTIPYLDAQEVVSIPPVPLSGAGIYHKGQPLYGGFVAPKIFIYDIGPHIQVPNA